MKVVMLMFDSLNRHMLPPYGCDWTHAPNFQRLAERTLTFDRSYICSMPCMPARRDLHTGRPNFLHRSWGPLEPFDDSVPRLLRQNGVSSHLISDHYHYWEAGGATYHTQYNTWEFFRGQEGDPWIGQVEDPPKGRAHGSNDLDGPWHRQDRVNRQHMQREADQPQAKTFDAGIDFLRRNSDQDNWLLQIETFDPHEPFFTQRHYQDMYRELVGDGADGFFDWPQYQHVQESRALIDQCRGHYASLLSMCDAKLGDLLDTMDQQNMWDDTMLVVWTDHGFLLSEHDCWAKCWMPFYEEVAHTPFFVWDPRQGQAGQRRDSLVQPSIDLGPTLLDFFGLEPTPDMRGHGLQDVIAADRPVREAAIFGQHGHQVNITDGRYVYMRSPASKDNAPLYDYTLMPTRMREAFSVDELAGQIELAEPFSFTKGCSTMKIPSKGSFDIARWDTALYDLQGDPGQQEPVQDEAVEQRLAGQMRALMESYDAPAEQYQRLGL
ncbi:MAG: sulfatase-like hydrolase/transferase [Candidatus Latescibacteria bacterium]|nr:sulfatase-like hydrolase/transferase [Candidatus Latescibacterota bacterium]